MSGFRIVVEIGVSGFRMVEEDIETSWGGGAGAVEQRNAVE